MSLARGLNYTMDACFFHAYEAGVSLCLLVSVYESGSSDVLVTIFLLGGQLGTLGPLYTHKNMARIRIVKLKDPAQRLPRSQHPGA